MKRILVWVGGVVLTLALTSSANAQYGWRGGAYYNPWTGRVVNTGTLYNPWTGGYIYGRSSYNPWTGRVRNTWGYGASWRNPWTGRHGYRVRVY